MQSSLLSLCCVAIFVTDLSSNAFQPSPPLASSRRNLDHHHVKRHQLHMADPTIFVGPPSIVGDSSVHVSRVEGLLKPAHEHTQPLFGPPDKYLSAGHSIAPNVKALAGGEGAAATTTTTRPVDQLPEVAQAAAKKGWYILDAAKMENGGGSVLPGFSKIGHILPTHADNIPEANMESFTAQVFTAAKFLPVLEKLPVAAFVYVLFDFFLLRPDVDLYKEDIEEEPFEVAAETAAVTGVRLATFAVIGFLTVVAFG